MFTSRRFSSEKNPELLGIFVMMEAGTDRIQKTIDASLVIFHFTEWFYNNVAYFELSSESFIQNVAEKASSYMQQTPEIDCYVRLRQAVYVVAAAQVLQEKITEIKPDNQSQEREKTDCLQVIQQLKIFSSGIVKMAHSDVVVDWMPVKSQPNKKLIQCLQTFANSLDRIHKSARQYGW